MNYSKYYIVRGTLAFWKRDVPVVGPSEFRQLAITSNEWNSTAGVFQVYGVKGFSDGVVGGEFSVQEETIELLFDEDFLGLERAEQKAEELAEAFEQQGFRRYSMMDDFDICREVSAQAHRSAARVS